METQSALQAQAVRTGVDLARLLRGRTDMETKRAVEAMVRPYLETLPTAVRTELIDAAFLRKDQEVQEALFRRHVSWALVDWLLPALSEHIARELAGGKDLAWDRAAVSKTAMSKGTAQPNLVDTAEALRHLADWCTAGEMYHRARHHVAAAAGHVVDQAEALTMGVVEYLNPEAEFPDLALVSHGLLRLDSMKWVLESLGHPLSLARVTGFGRALARQTLNAATATIERFLADPNLLTLFDNVGVISQVDNLLLVVARVMEAQEDVRAGTQPEFVSIDGHALSHFMRGLERLQALLFRGLTRSIGRTDADPSVPMASLKQLHYLATLCLGAGLTVDPGQFDPAARRLEAGFARLAHDIGGVVTGLAIADPPDLAALRRALVQAQAVKAMLADTGSHDANAILTDYLRSAEMRLTQLPATP